MISLTDPKVLSGDLKSKLEVLSNLTILATASIQHVLEAASTPTQLDRVSIQDQEIKHQRKQCEKVP
tara:strand:- start:940 stop:1140 length:201 start_codon:yes stop_codon:yes gene_type:complete